MVGRLLERPLGITDHLPSLLLTEEDIENPSVDLISLRLKDTKISSQTTDCSLCHEPGLGATERVRTMQARAGRKSGLDSVRNGGEMRDCVGGL